MRCTLLLSKTRTARKPHRCIWCGEPINAGEKYIDHRYVSDDGPAADHYHPECDEAASRSDTGDGFVKYQFLRGLNDADSEEEIARRYNEENP